MPKALKDRPTLDFRQAPFYNAFQRLTGSRQQIPMAGPGQIPMSEILAYCQLYKVHDVEKVDELVDWVQILDRHYLEIVEERREKPKK